jgi:hypothetical protein
MQKEILGCIFYDNYTIRKKAEMSLGLNTDKGMQILTIAQLV